MAFGMCPCCHPALLSPGLLPQFVLLQMNYQGWCLMAARLSAERLLWAPASRLGWAWPWLFPGSTLTWQGKMGVLRPEGLLSPWPGLAAFPPESWPRSSAAL